MSGASNGGDVPSTPSEPFVRWLLWHQFQINCLASVSIEYPRLRRYLRDE